MFTHAIRPYSVCEIGSKIGDDQSPEDAEDGPPELLVGDFHYSVQLSDENAFNLTVHSRWAHGQDFRLLVESQRAVGPVLGQRG